MTLAPEFLSLTFQQMFVNHLGPLYYCWPRRPSEKRVPSVTGTMGSAGVLGPWKKGSLTPWLLWGPPHVRLETEDPVVLRGICISVWGQGLLWTTENWWGKADWTLWNYQRRYLQGCFINLSKTSPGTTQPVWVKNLGFHSMIRFLGCFAIYSLPFPCSPVLIWQVYRRKSKPFHWTTTILFFAILWSGRFPFSLC